MNSRRISCFMRFPGPCLAMASAFLCATVLAQSQAPTGASVQASMAGKIDLVAGDVHILQTGKQPRGATVGDTVNEGDTLVTGKDSELHVTMQDTGFIALRPNTRVKVVSMKADGGNEDNAVFSLLVGSLRSITGWIGRYNPKAYLVRTPTATIGIRGTDHETRYIPPDSSEGEPGTYDKVFAGETAIQNAAGVTAVTPDHAGYGSNNAAQVPQVLPRVPAFFRPGPHEDLINSKHAEIQKMIEQRREERRKIVAEKQAAVAAARDVLTAQSEKNKAEASLRQAAADQQQRETDAVFANLHQRQAALKKKQEDVQTTRQKIRETLANGLSPNVRMQLKRVGQEYNAMRSEWQELGQAYKAANDKHQAGIDARKLEGDEQGQRTQVRLAEFTANGKALQERYLELQQRRDALQAKSAAGQDKNGSLNEERKALREAGEAADKEQKQLITAQNELFDSNIAMSEARLHAGDEQRHHNAQVQSALNDREQALQQRQAAVDTRLLTIQEQSAKEQGLSDKVRDWLQSVRESLEAMHKERLDLIDIRRALRKKNVEAIDERQRQALAQLQEVKQKHVAMREKVVDLQQERESMQQEIRMLYEQEQKRYREELLADRQLNATVTATATTPSEP